MEYPTVYFETQCGEMPHAHFGSDVDAEG